MPNCKYTSSDGKCKQFDSLLTHADHAVCDLETNCRWVSKFERNSFVAELRCAVLMPPYAPGSLTIV